MKKVVTALAASVALLFAAPAAPGHAQSNGQDEDVVFSASLFDGMQYRTVGPSRGGRVTTVAGHPSHPETFYMGTVGGGIWKTTDYGQTWRPISDGYLSTGSMGAIRVAPSNPNVIYAGTGSDGIRSNVITGKGVYKSTNAGRSWEFIGLPDAGQIGAVEVHPTNPDLVYVAAMGNAFKPNPERGVYRSSDGGRNWSQVLFVSDSTGAVDLELAPDNPNEIYVGMYRGERKPWTIISGAMEGGIYKSSDGGDSWSKLGGGLPQGLFGKTDLAVSPAEPDRVYTLVEAPEPEDGLYRSDDRGATWRQVSSYNPIMNRPFYYTGLDADPTNADIVYVNNEGFYKSTNGGADWERRSTPHGDNHDMWINPDDPDLFIQSNDGGANVTRDGGETWSTQNNQQTAELYQVDIDDRFLYWLYAGQQDNSTITVPSREPYDAAAGYTAYWRAIGGCETGPAVPKPGNPDIVYANCKGRFGRYSWSTDQEKQYYVGAWDLYGRNPADLPYRFQRTAPIHVSPNDPDVVYHTSQYVHRTTDDDVNWETISPDLTAFEPETQMASGSPITRDITGEEHYSVIYDIQESPHDPDVIWTGANDGPIHVTRDGGASWTDVTPDMPGRGRVQNVEVSPHNPAKAYATILRYQLGDFQPYGFKTENYGQSWTRITTGQNGIPDDHPMRVIREDPDRTGLLYAGTEFGMFFSFDDGARWQSFKLNMPTTPITDMKVHQKDLVLSTMGRGFWILDNLGPLHELSDRVAAADAHLFEPRPSYRAFSGGFGGFGGSDPAAPKFPAPGAGVDYYVADGGGLVTLEILDASGTVVRSFSSEDTGEQLVPPAEPSMRAPTMERIGTPRLDNSAGMHRFAWDFRYPGPWDSNQGRAGRSGPVAVPGSYQARLSVGNYTATESFEVLMDPRVAADGVTVAHLRSQFELAMEVRDALSQARMAAAKIAEAKPGLSDREEMQEALEALQGIEGALINDQTEGVRYPERMLLSQMNYLYSMLNRADQVPGRDAQVRYEELEAELQEHIRNLERILRSTITAADGA